MVLERVVRSKNQQLALSTHTTLAGLVQDGRNMRYVKPDRIALKGHPELTERWVQDRLADDLARLDRVVARITHGLYWHHHGHTRLPSDHEVGVWSEDGLRDISRQDVEDLRKTLVDPVLDNPRRSIARDVLRYGTRPVIASM